MIKGAAEVHCEAHIVCAVVLGCHLMMVQHFPFGLRCLICRACIGQVHKTSRHINLVSTKGQGGHSGHHMQLMV